ncbi:DUF3344 domain-containing protein [bacterium]|nr:DUF3344 domain-containing protein [bacterium]
MVSFGQRRPLALAAALLFGAAAPLRAGYLFPGFDLQPVQTATNKVGSHLFVEGHPIWDYSIPGPVSASFDLPAGTSVDFGRIYFHLWGGSPYKTGHVHVNVNGTDLPAVYIGGDGGYNAGGWDRPDYGPPGPDTNPTHDASQTCVYGSGYGTWAVAMDVQPQLTLGATNTIQVAMDENDTDESGAPILTGFDSRVAGVSLVAEYQTGDDNSLTYILAEGDAYMRKDYRLGTPMDRYVDLFNPVAGFTDADLFVHYYGGDTFWGGHTEQADELSFNGTLLPDDDGDLVLNIADSDDGHYYDLDVFDVLSLAQQMGGNQLHFHNIEESGVNPAFTVLRLQGPADEVYTPEPGSLALLAVGLGGLLARRRKRPGGTERR